MWYSEHKFPIQDKPGLDLVMVELNECFGGQSLEVHDTIVKIMEAEKIPLEDKSVRKILSQMAIQTAKLLSR